MAIGTTPLFKEISGSVGPVDFRTRRNGKIEIGKKRIPANPQSTRQLEVRAGYGRLHELWQNASYIDKAQYERLGKLYNTSAWNAFLMRHQSAMSAAPVASWGMVEDSGLELHDLTINENLGTISGATWEQTGPADLSVLCFDGIDDVVDCGINSILNLTGELAIETWIFNRSAINYQGIITRRNSNIYTNQSYGIFVDALTYPECVFLIADGANVNHARFNVPLFTWTHIVGVLSTTKIQSFQNGILHLDKPRTINPLSTNDPLRLGYFWLQEHFDGKLALTNIYDFAPTDTQILQRYNNTKHLFGVYP